MSGIFRTVGSTTPITVAATTAAVALPAGMNDTDRTVRLAAPADNAGPVFVAFGVSGVTTAVATGMPILPGTVEVFMPGTNVTHIATIGDAADTLYVTVGEGI